jgi:hypothetical protein
MNVQQNDQKKISDAKDLPLPPVDLLKMRKPVGSFAGSQDFVLRIRNGKLVAADTGEQGGGQN